MKRTLKQTLVMLLVLVTLMSNMSISKVFASEVDRSFTIYNDVDKPSGDSYMTMNFYKYFENENFILYTKDDMEFQPATHIARLDAIIAAFAPAYTQLLADFGQPYDVDNNGKIAILIHDLTSVMGVTYFTHAVMLTDLPECNHTDIFELNSNYVDPIVGYTVASAVSTMVHEAQHMIHKVVDSNETNFVNEMLSVFTQEYYANDSAPMRVMEYFNRMNNDDVELDTHEYAEHYFFSKYIFINHGGLQTMLDIRNNQNDEYASVMSTLNIPLSGVEERNFIYGLLDYTLDDFFFNNAGWAVTLDSMTSGGNLTLKSRKPMLRYLKPSKTTVELTLDAEANAAVEYLVKEVSFTALAPRPTNFDEVQTLRLQEGTTTVTMSDEDNYLLITPIYANLETSTTWSYSAVVANTLPVAVNDTYSVNEKVTLNGSSVLVNDTDSEDTTVATATLVDDAANGTLTLNADGTFTYVPDNGFVGTDTFTYKATDLNAGQSNTATVTITVNDIPNTLPVVTLTGSASINLLVGDAYNELGATATDAEDGNLVPVVIGAVNTAAVGTYVITYTAIDSELGTNQATRTINVTTGDAPVVTLNGSNTTINYKATYTDLGASATDTEDGDVNVVVSGDMVDSTTPGIYTITYTATDANGNSSAISRVVTVNTNQAPVVTRTGAATITLTVGDVYNELSATATDAEDGNLVPVVTGSVDTATEGSYTITYAATDEDGLSSSVTRVITVNAAAPVVIATPVIAPPVVAPPVVAPPVVALPILPVVESDVIVPTVVGTVATVQATSEKGIAEVTFTTKDLKVGSSATVESDLAKVVIPANVLAVFEDVKLEVSTNVTLTAAQKAVAGTATVYDFALSNVVGDKVSKVSTFTEALTITVPYTLKAGENAAYVTVYFINDNGTLENMKGVYANGKVTFTTTHFSKYMVKQNLVSFTDTTNNHIITLASKGIIEGKGNNSFDPKGELTRAELATLLVKALNLKINTNAKFTDVKSSDWFYNYVLTAKVAGIVNGTGNGIYDPASKVKTQDAMIMISRVMELYKGSINKATVLGFDNTSDYAKKNISHLVSLGFVSSSFSAGNKNITREEMAELVYSMYFFK